MTGTPAFAPENECAIVNALESIAESLKELNTNLINIEAELILIRKNELPNITGAIRGEY